LLFSAKPKNVCSAAKMAADMVRAPSVSLSQGDVSAAWELPRIAEPEPAVSTTVAMPKNSFQCS